MYAIVSSVYAQKIFFSKNSHVQRGVRNTRTEECQNLRIFLSNISRFVVVHLFVCERQLYEIMRSNSYSCVHVFAKYFLFVNISRRVSWESCVNILGSKTLVLLSDGPPLIIFKNSIYDISSSTVPVVTVLFLRILLCSKCFLGRKIIHERLYRICTLGWWVRMNERVVRDRMYGIRKQIEKIRCLFFNNSKFSI